MFISNHRLVNGLLKVHSSPQYFPGSQFSGASVVNPEGLAQYKGDLM